MVKKFEKFLKEFYQHVVKFFYNWRYTWIGIWLGGFSSQLAILLDKKQNVKFLLVESAIVLSVIIMLIMLARVEYKERNQ